MAVVVPCYNYGRYLRAAVQSALTQPGVQVEVIVVDDASTDDSLDVAGQLAKEDPRVVVIEHQLNRGAVATFNSGLAACSAEFLVRLDADDLLAPGSLARSTGAARAFPSVGLVYGHALHFTGPPPATSRSGVRRWVAWPGLSWLADRCKDALNVITAPEVLMRSSVVERVGGQMPIAHAHDMEMWLRMAAFSDVMYLEGPDQAFHREHDGSLSTRQSRPLDDVRERRAAFSTLFSGPAGAVSGASEMERAARSAMARQALMTAAHEYDRNRPDEHLTQECIAFALETYPEVVETRAWASLQRRMSLGAPGVRLRPWYAASASARRLRSVAKGKVHSLRGTYSGR